jgi:chloride channel protein, CIC family
MRLTSDERTTLLVAGATGGMSATFASPVAAVLLAVELLLFEWKPRSLIPVALASATAAATRRYILGLGQLFPTPPHPVFIGPEGLLGCVVVGVLAVAHSLDVVAGHRRFGDRLWWFDFPAGARRRL